MMNKPTKWWLISDGDIQIVRDGLAASTYEANDYNCEEWPPGNPCRGCEGKEMRRQALHALDSGLHITDAIPEDWKNE